MSNKKKKVLLAIGILFLIGLHRYVMKTDLTLVRKFRQPKFCIAVNSYKDDGEGTYWGLGYSFDIESFFPEKETPSELLTPDFTYYSTKILGLEIDSRWIDYDPLGLEGTVLKVEESEEPDVYYVYVEDIGQNICIIDGGTNFENANSRGNREIREGDVVQIYAVHFQFMQPAGKDNWLYYASSVKFLESDMD